MSETEPLHVAAFNAENFYLLLDRDLDQAGLESMDEAEYRAMNSSIYNPNKARDKIAAIARVILEEDFDLISLAEVGGRETLEAFNRIYLGGAYSCHIHEENSRRGIYVGALAKRERLPRVSAASLPGDFSRNLLRLDLASGGAHLAVFCVHLKSQRGRDRGIAERMREISQLVSAVRSDRCVVMGDFNGILIPGEHQFEYEPFISLPFRDVLEEMRVPPERRWTHYYFNPRPNFSQLDYIFCSRDIEILEAGVIEDAVPASRAQASRLPSDHLFIRAKIRPRAASAREAP